MIAVDTKILTYAQRGEILNEETMKDVLRLVLSELVDLFSGKDLVRTQT